MWSIYEIIHFIILVTYLIKNKHTRSLPNFYSKVIICWIYSVFHHRPSNLKIMNVHLSQRLALYYMYTLTVISATNTNKCMPGSQPKILKIFQTEFRKLKLTIPWTLVSNMNFMRYLTGQHNMLPIITIGKPDMSLS